MDIIPAASPGELILLEAPRTALKQALLPLVARLAPGSALRILDCGNCFNVYVVARELRRHTTGVQEALERIHVSRAFACYQAAALLAETTAEMLSGTLPTIVLDLLSTFADENVGEAERRRLLAGCVHHLLRLKHGAAVTVSVSLHSVLDASWLVGLEEAADRIWRLEPELLPLPPRLL